MGKKVLLVGWHPSAVNYEKWPGLTPEKLEAALRTDEAKLKELGFEATLAFVHNSDTAADLFILDPAFLGLSYLEGYRNDVLGKTGLSDQRMLSVQWMTKVFHEDAQAMIADIDHTLAVTAS